MTSTKSWYLQHLDIIVGPLTSAQLRALAQSRTINENTLVRLGDAGKWFRASKIQKLFESLPTPEAHGGTPVPQSKIHLTQAPAKLPQPLVSTSRQYVAPTSDVVAETPFRTHNSRGLKWWALRTLPAVAILFMVYCFGKYHGKREIADNGNSLTQSNTSADAGNSEAEALGRQSHPISNEAEKEFGATSPTESKGHDISQQELSIETQNEKLPDGSVEKSVEKILDSLLDVAQAVNSPKKVEPNEIPIVRRGNFANFQHFRYRVIQSEWISKLHDNPFLNRPPNASYFRVRIAIENIGDDARTVPPFFIIDDKGRRFELSPNAILLEESIKPFERLNPGISKEFSIVFDVPKGVYFLEASASTLEKGIAYMLLN